MFFCFVHELVVSGILTLLIYNFYIFMFTKQQLSKSISNEIRIIKHLATKISAGQYHFKPTDSQRSMIELMQYMSFIGVAGTELILTGDMSIFGPYTEASTHVHEENFAEHMDKQDQAIQALLEKFTDEELAKEVDLFRMGNKTKAEYLVETVFKWFVAYKMQLFLYIKQAGNTTIGTSNLWGGFDMPAAE